MIDRGHFPRWSRCVLPPIGRRRTRTITPNGCRAGEPSVTAPHATAAGRMGPRRGPTPAQLPGPERFWWHRPVSVAFLVALALSLVAHGSAFPLEWPSGFEVKDLDGEAAIAVDLLQESPPEEFASPPGASAARREPPRGECPDADSASSETARPVATTSFVHRTMRALDRRRRSRATRAGTQGKMPTCPTEPVMARMEDPDAGSSTLLGMDAGRADEYIAGASWWSKFDRPLSSWRKRQRGSHRKRPWAALRSAALLRGISSSGEDFMSGTDIDPVRDTDWLMISGPSLVNTASDVILIRYGASDVVVDRAIARVSQKYPGGGPYDAGVPGVKATLAHADRAERVLLRPIAPRLRLSCPLA